MLKLEIALENPYFDAPYTGDRLARLLHDVAYDIEESVTDRGEFSRAIMSPRTGGRAERAEVGSWSMKPRVSGPKPTTVETRRDRLTRRLIWTFLPGVKGQGTIHVRLDVMMPGRGFMTDQEFHLLSELTPDLFWVSVRRLQARILDRAEGLADALS